MSETEKDPIEQAVELLLYAPVGLLYEYQNVLPQLIKRGKSQVQLARVIGKMAVNSQTNGVDDSLEKVVGSVIGTTAQVLTEFGQAIGLAPPKTDSAENDHESTSSRAASSGNGSSSAPAIADSGHARSDAADKRDAKRLPIARYDELKAKEVIALLDDLKPEQRARIGDYEQANRARKTILAKIERLG